MWEAAWSVCGQQRGVDLHGEHSSLFLSLPRRLQSTFPGMQMGYDDASGLVSPEDGNAFVQQ